MLECSCSYYVTSRRLWIYYRDEINGVGDNALQGKSIEYQTNIKAKTSPQPAQPKQPS